MEKLSTKSLILDLPGQLEASEPKLTAEHKNIWHHKFSAIHTMESQLISGHSGFSFTSCFSLNIPSKVKIQRFRSRYEGRNK